MATSPVQSSNPFQQLAATLLKSADTNSDGNLSRLEFTDFLSRLVNNLGNGTSLGTNASPSVGGSTKSGGIGQLLGFDSGKLADTSHLTVKYLFGRVAQNYDVSSVRSKADAEALLNSMRAELEAAGVTVLEIKGDKIRVLDDQGQEALVDVVKGSTGNSPAFQWLDTRF